MRVKSGTYVISVVIVISINIVIAICLRPMPRVTILIIRRKCKL